jgi:glycerol uptake facilitator-like aquaporin
MFRHILNPAISQPKPVSKTLDSSSLRQQLLAEFAGTAALLCAVIGSGIMAEHLSGGNTGVALLANTFATVFALYVLIELLGPVSGAHFNPLVTLVLWSKSPIAQEGRAQLALLFIASQLLGAVAGAWLAHLMFGLDVLQFSSKLRGGWNAAGQFSGWGQWIAEAVATAGLMLVVLRAPPSKAAAMVACYIGAAYWFTASTSFANPAAVVGRLFSDSFSGIAPQSAPGFIVAEAIGAGLGVLLSQGLGKPASQNNQ